MFFGSGAKKGLIMGSASGAAMAAALKLADRIDSGKIVVVFPDRGDRYFSKIFTEIIPSFLLK